MQLELTKANGITLFFTTYLFSNNLEKSNSEES